MMIARLLSVKATIQHVRNRRKRMPVGSMHMCEGPSNPLEGETVRDLRIFENVLKVVQVDEVVPKGLAEDDPDNCHKDRADDASYDPFTISGRRKAVGCAALWSH